MRSVFPFRSCCDDRDGYPPPLILCYCIIIFFRFVLLAEAALSSSASVSFLVENVCEGRMLLQAGLHVKVDVIRASLTAPERGRRNGCTPPADLVQARWASRHRA